MKTYKTIDELISLLGEGNYESYAELKKSAPVGAYLENTHNVKCYIEENNTVATIHIYETDWKDGHSFCGHYISEF